MVYHDHQPIEQGVWRQHLRYGPALLGGLATAYVSLTGCGAIGAANERDTRIVVVEEPACNAELAVTAVNGETTRLEVKDTAHTPPTSIDVLDRFDESEDSTITIQLGPDDTPGSTAEQRTLFITRSARAADETGGIQTNCFTENVFYKGLKSLGG